MVKNITCKCGKVLGVRRLETQEITLSNKASVVSSNTGDVRILFPYCKEVITEVGNIKK